MNGCLLRLLCMLGVLAGFVSAVPAWSSQHVILQLPWHHQFQFAGYYMALQQGYFKAAGLNVEILDVTDNADTVAAVVAGLADFGVSGSGLLVERSLGRPVVAIAAIFQEDPAVLIALKSSGINSLNDLAGRRVMLAPGYKSLPLVAMLDQENLLAKITRLETSFDYHSLLRHETDLFNAYLSNEPYLLESQGIEINVFDPRDADIHFYGDVLFTSESFAEKYPETVGRFRQAVIKGWHYALSHVDETIAHIKSHYHVEKSRTSLKYEAEVLARAINVAGTSLGQMDVARWAQINQHLIATGQISPRFQLTDAFLYSPPEKIHWQRLRPWLIGMLTLFFFLLLFLLLVSRANVRVRKALWQLSDSETRYRRLVSHVPGLIYSYALSSRHVDYPPDVLSVLGFPLEYVQEHPGLWFNSIHPDDRIRVDKAHRDTDFEQMCELEYRLRTRSGEWRWFHDRFSKRYDDSQGTLIDGVATDITEHRYIVQQQQLADQKMREALDAVSDGVWEWHLPGEKLTLDKQSRKLFGFAPESCLTPQDVLQLIVKADLASAKESFARLLSGKLEKLDLIFRVQRQDGQLVWLRGRGRVIDRDSSGRPIRLIGTNVDVTERQLAVQKVHESEQRFRNLIEQVSRIAIQGYDEQRRVIFWNKASEALYGFTEAEALGRQLEDLIIPAAMRSEVVAGIRRWQHEGTAIPAGELVLIDKQGQDVPVFSSHVMYETAASKEMYCVDVDMRQVRDAQQKRLELEEQLRQVHKMEAIGTMAGGIAHDFNNSLAIILGNVELSLLKLAGDHPVVPFLANAKSTILRSKELVQQILIYSRQGVQHREEINFAQKLTDVIRMLRSTIPTTVELSLHIPESLEDLVIRADVTQIQQIVINLCNNAVHAMKQKGELRVSLALKSMQEHDFPRGQKLPAGLYACLIVEDNGCGMEAEILEKIFDPFFTTKGIGEGTGMGLSVVQGIVDSHGGFISAESHPGLGTKFKVFFPALDLPPPLSSADISEPDPAALPGGTERILLVDDEEPLLHICRGLLCEYGYQVTTVNSSRRALELFRRDPAGFDLVITDQTMPAMTGTELSTAMIQERPDLPIILCSGYSAVSEEHAATKPAIREYCQKPLNLSELLVTIRKVLDAG